MEAGREFLRALDKLGFAADGAAWVVDNGLRSGIFVIVSRWADKVGVMPIYDLLFRAQDAGVIPREPKVWDIEVLSPENRMIDHFGRIMGESWSVEDAHITTPSGQRHPLPTDMVWRWKNFEFRPRWLVKAWGNSAGVSESANWHEFEKRVIRMLVRHRTH